ncbi:CotH kinase family protein [Luteolibacter sp. SL250]|uniref:CotH kinase family protein n=1 Tax=Luteolibacter sp. SL250 TaxID=2995170 RepID=UPI0022700CC0|nr:CotH kinase family protein [Luteolibacter sp. SL250]WAC21494.1 CotH kinase family protein [Luteolibacter sp. SL250]
MRGSPFHSSTLCLLAMMPCLTAAPVAVTGMQRSGNQILGLTVNGANISRDRLQTGTLTSFAGATASVVLAVDGSSTATGAAAEGYLSDFLFDTGLINPAVGEAAVTLESSPALVNRPGPDIVLLEINTGAPADGFQVRINGVTQQVAGSAYGSTGYSTSGADVLDTRNSGNTSALTVASLAQLRAAPLAESSSNISQQVFGVALDLSDFGVADGGTVSSIQLGSNTLANFDPVFVAGIVPAQVITSGPIISEFLTDNGEGIEDEDGNKPDWIEIYNGTDTPLDLTGWALTNSAATPKRWLFPAGAMLQPYEYKLIFASSKNRTGPVLHTNFNLGKGGGHVALVRPDATTASSYTYTAQSEDISYGVMGTALTQGFLATPTPGVANFGVQSPNGPAADVVFSAASGVISAPIQLTLSLPAGASGTIRYTTDLSEPLETSPIYTAPVIVTNSTTVRARVFRPDHLPGFIGNRHFIRMGDNVKANYRSTGQPFQSNLPVLVLDSFGVNVDSNTSQSAPYRTTLAAIYEPDQVTGKTSLGATPNQVLRGGTHVRGQSSAGFPQKQYAWELWRDHIDEDEKLPVLGMPEGADWVLHAPWNDKSLMRNALAYGLARDWAGPGAGMRTRFVEVFFNQAGTTLDHGDYRGVYVLVEKIKRDEERVDVEELTPLATDITGGYIFSKDKPPYDNGFTTTTSSAWGGQPLDMVEPGTPTSAQIDYLRTYMNGFEAALSGSGFADPATGYAAYIDATSFQDWHLMAEFARQTDAYQNSNYFHKKRGQKVKALPVWDFNLSFANNSETESGGSAQPGQGPGEGWHWIRLFDDWLSQKGPSHYPWFPRLFQDPEFRRGYWDRWWEKRAGVLTDEAVAARVDGMAAQLTAGLSTPVTNGTGTWPNSTPSVESPAGRHFARWQILGTYVWTTPIGWQDRTTHAHEVSLLKQWLQARLEWMDTQSMATTPTTAAGSVASIVARPPRITFSGGSGFGLANPNPDAAEVLYTIDGPDPRELGGAASPAAVTTSAAQMNQTELLPVGAAWKFSASSSLPVSWSGDGFDDSGWAVVSSVREQTQMGTTYFRRTFNASGTGSMNAVRFDLLADDGAVVWLNGVELRRVGMPFSPTPVDHATSATAVIDKGHETEWMTWISPPGVLREGSNTIAIQVHQYTHVNGVAKANDLSFDLRVRALSQVAGTPASTTPGMHVVRARVRNGTQWSPLAQATLNVSTVPAAAANLVVTELMYHPADPSTPEEAGYVDNDFEYIELANIGTQTIDLSGVTLAEAVTFSFDNAPAGLRTLAPGGRVLVVANTAAFAVRYPPPGDITPPPVLPVAGQYTGSFNNSTETVSVLDATGAVIRRFTYQDAEPWPVDADGTGASMVLKAVADLDHTVPGNWHASAALNGGPGKGDHLPPVLDPNGDSNGDGMSNFLEAAIGGRTLPRMSVAPFTPEGGTEEAYALFTFRRSLAVAGVDYIAESSLTLGDDWGTTDLIHVSTRRQPDGTAAVTYRSAVPASQMPAKWFARLRVK